MPGWAYFRAAFKNSCEWQTVCACRSTDRPPLTGHEAVAMQFNISGLCPSLNAMSYIWETLAHATSCTASISGNLFAQDPWIITSEFGTKRPQPLHTPSVHLVLRDDGGHLNQEFCHLQGTIHHTHDTQAASGEDSIRLPSSRPPFGCRPGAA